MQVYNRLSPKKQERFGQTADKERLKAQDSLFRQPAQPIQVDLTDNSLWYGSDNAFPLKLATLVQESPAASSCISVLSDFLEGSGFSDETLKDKKINARGQTFGDIHNLVCESYALFEGFSLIVKYTREGKISEIFHYPFENCRLQRPDSKGIISKININPYYGTSIYQRVHTEEYDTFNADPIVVRSQMAKQKEKYKGQILYVAFTRPLSRFYPQPYYFSAKSWMGIDAGIGAYHENNLDAGFFVMVLMKMIGDPDAPSTHPDDQRINDQGQKESIRTRGQRFDMIMQQFVGAESNTKMMVLWEMMKDQLPELQAFPTSTNTDFFVALQNLTTKNILIAMKIPSILANMGGENSLSDGNQMANATRVMHDRVKKPQNLLTRTYKTLLSVFKEPYAQDIKILNTNSFEAMAKIDPEVWAALTPEEKRKWIKENTDYPIEDTLAAPAPAATPEPVNQFQNVLFTDYPEGAKKNAERALKWMDDNAGCGKPMGKRLAQDIVDSKPLSFKDIRRIYNYLRRNREHDGKLFSDSCESCLFSAWGGKPMHDYCEAKIKMINE